MWDDPVEAIHRYEDDESRLTYVGEFLGYGPDYDTGLFTTFVHWLAVLRLAGIKVERYS